MKKVVINCVVTLSFLIVLTIFGWILEAKCYNCNKYATHTFAIGTSLFTTFFFGFTLAIISVYKHLSGGSQGEYLVY